MGYVLLAIESVIVAWLAIALAVVLTRRWRSRFLRALVVGGTTLLAIAPFAGAVFFAYAANRVARGRFDAPWLLPLESAIVVLVLGAIGVIVLAWRGSQPRPLEGDGGMDGDNDAQPTTIWSAGRLALALVVMLLLVNSTFTNLDALIRSHLSDVRHEAEMLALSVSPQPVPERDNAAPLYVAIGDHFGRANPTWPDYWDDASQALDLPLDPATVMAQAPEAGDAADQHAKAAETGDAPFDFTRRDLAEFLKRQAGARQLLLEAAAKPGCNFSRDYSRPRFDMLLPELNDLRSSARLLAIDARHRIATGDYAGAAENVQAMYGIADHASTDPLLICLLVAIAIDRMASDTLAHLLAAADDLPAELSSLQIDPAVSHFDRMNRAMRMEEAIVLGAFSDFDQRGGGAIDGLPRLGSFGGSLFRVFLLPSDLAAYRKVMASGAYSPSLTYKQMRDRQDTIEKNHSRSGILTSLLTPSLGALTTATARGEAARRLARVGLAMQRYRQVHGEFPDDLEKLSPDFLPLIPRDPFDGEPLRMRPLNGGYVIYSIGQDLKDDYGRVDPKSTDGDVIFVCRAPRAMAEQGPDERAPAEQ